MLKIVRCYVAQADAVSMLSKPSMTPACFCNFFSLQEDYRPQIEEMAFLQDVEQNDGRLMLFQLPALLPIAQQVGWMIGAALLWCT